MPAILSSISKARRVLIVLWFAFFVINISILLYLYLTDLIEIVDFTPAMKNLNAVYSPYLGAITMFYWGSKKKKSTNKKDKPGIAFSLVLLCSFIWNAMILVFLLPLIFLSGTLESALQNINNTGILLSWLISGAIGYYFAKE